MFPKFLELSLDGLLKSSADLIRRYMVVYGYGYKMQIMINESIEFASKIQFLL